jgi:hypothetical protein
LLAGIAAAALLPAGCQDTPGAAASADRPVLGLMTSLPLYWPDDAAFADIAAGRAAPPWQRRQIETRYRIVPLDTLSPVPALSPDQPDSDPLAGLARLAVIQPRGLSPADNVALDQWVRAGGQLLLVLDPVLTVDYAAPLGDPRRPVDSALIPPVVARWGLEIAFSEDRDAGAEPGSAALPGGGAVPLAYPGTITLTPGGARNCVRTGPALATCRIGKGQVTLLADAALFEHPELAGAQGETLLALLAAALDRGNRG